MAITLISTVTVGAGGAASIDFTSIPGTYTDLKIVTSLRAAVANTDVNITFNGSTANLNSRQMYGAGSGAGASATNATKVLTYGGAVASTYTANTFSNAEIYVANYAGSTSKPVAVDALNENNAVAAYQSIVAGLWANSAAITQVTLKSDTGNLAEFSTATLYGILKGTSGGTVVS